MVKLILFASLTMMSFMWFKVYDTYKQEEEIFLADAEFRVRREIDDYSHERYDTDTRCDMREEKLKFRPVNYKDQIYEVTLECAGGLLTDRERPFTVRATAYRRGARVNYLEYKFDRP
jgi:hypothetical protein